jgi:hypothetical protein
MLDLTDQEFPPRSHFFRVTLGGETVFLLLSPMIDCQLLEVVAFNNRVSAKHTPSLFRKGMIS